MEGFPGGAVVENLPANAGDTGSSPGLGRSHMPWSSWAHEPQLLSLCVWSLCSTTREATILRGPRTVMKSGPRLPQLEKALAQKRKPNIAINQSISKIFKKKKRIQIKKKKKVMEYRTQETQCRREVKEISNGKGQPQNDIYTPAREGNASRFEQCGSKENLLRAAMITLSVTTPSF